jgi:2-oxoglutarate dehydrogenase complex dehydrogenase (E1) component-like enzyme
MRNSKRAKMISPTRGTGFQLTGLGLSPQNRFHVSETPGKEFFPYSLIVSCVSYAHIFDVMHLRPCSVKPEILKRVGEAMTTLPETFKPHRAVKKIFDLRRQMIESGEGIDWAVGEALAFATLIIEGNHVRLSGQDVERGTFSHRHSVIHDQETGEQYCPLDNLVMNQNEELFTVSNRYGLVSASLTVTSVMLLTTKYKISIMGRPKPYQLVQA